MLQNIRNPIQPGEGVRTNQHHMIQKFKGGSLLSYNIVRVSIETHLLAHQLLFDRDGFLEDASAVRLIGASILRTDEKRQAIKKKTTDTRTWHKLQLAVPKLVLGLKSIMCHSKIQVSGLHVLQQPLSAAKKAGERMKPYFMKGFQLLHPGSGNMITIAAKSAVNMDALLDLIISKLSQATEQKSRINYELISNQEKKGKRRFLKCELVQLIVVGNTQNKTFYGWSLTGTLVAGSAYFIRGFKLIHLASTSLIIIPVNSTVDWYHLLDLMIEKLAHSTETKSRINYEQLANQEKKGGKPALKYKLSKFITVNNTQNKKFYGWVLNGF